ncbi:MAG TPA: HNH endonuclease signature motif containing protein [Propionicimonas sp.]|jgi:hypothetical protein
MHIASPLEGTLNAVLREYDRDAKSFIKSHGLGVTTHVVVIGGRRYDAVAVERRMRSRLGDLTIDLAPSERSGIGMLIEEAGYRATALEEWSVADELAWRLDAWSHVQRLGNVVSPDWLRSRGLYGGAQGVWVDANRTRTLESPGVAVAVLHTGRHYADDLDEDLIIYHYPETYRAGLRDSNEIDSVRNARDLHLPVLVIAEVQGGRMRRVRLAWVVADDPRSGTFLMEFAETEPVAVPLAEPHEEAPFHLTGLRERHRVTHERNRRDTAFKFQLLHRYNGRCAITGLGVQDVLDGAHVVDVQHGGTDDVRNGLLLTANLHRAFDASLWALHPETLRVITRHRGPSLDDLQISTDRLRQNVPPPHRDALAWRYNRFVTAAKETSLDVAAG